MKQLTAFKTATSSLPFSILTKKCPGGNRTRSVWLGGEYGIRKFGQLVAIQTGIFGRMESTQRAHKKIKNWLLFGETELRGP